MNDFSVVVECREERYRYQSWDGNILFFSSDKSQSFPGPWIKAFLSWSANKWDEIPPEKKTFILTPQSVCTAANVTFLLMIESEQAQEKKKVNLNFMTVEKIKAHAEEKSYYRCAHKPAWKLEFFHRKLKNRQKRKQKQDLKFVGRWMIVGESTCEITWLFFCVIIQSLPWPNLDHSHR